MIQIKRAVQQYDNHVLLVRYNKNMKILERNGSFTSVMFQLGQPDIRFYSIIFLTMTILNINPGNHGIFAEKSKDQFHHQINYKKNMGGNNLFFLAFYLF